MRKLLREGHAIEFFLEGGRSRTGKLLPPKAGLLAMVADAADGVGAEVAYVPVSIGYERVVLVGNSGGASIVPYYQAQAIAPTVTSPPGGGPDLTTAGLRPVDAMVLLNAHPSRARLSCEWLDPAITDELRSFFESPPAEPVEPVTKEAGDRP